MSQQQISTHIVILLLVCSGLSLFGCDDDRDIAELRERLRKIEAENQRLREDNGQLAEQTHQENNPIAGQLSEHDIFASESSPSEMTTCGEAVAHVLGMMLKEYDSYPEKDVVKWVANSLDWSEIPKHLAEAGNANAAFTGAVFGHKLFLAKGDIQGLFTIATGENFDRDEFLEPMKDYIAIEIIESSIEFGTLSEIAQISTDGREIGMLVINSSKSQLTAGAGSVSFMPSSIAQQILRGH